MGLIFLCGGLHPSAHYVTSERGGEHLFWFQAAVVQLVRDHLKVMTLAIGDGANDVSMLQTAEVSAPSL